LEYKKKEREDLIGLLYSLFLLSLLKIVILTTCNSGIDSLSIQKRIELLIYGITTHEK